MLLCGVSLDGFLSLAIPLGGYVDKSIMEVSNKEATSKETTSKGTTSKEGANNQITKDPIVGGVPDTLLQVMALVTIVTTTEAEVGSRTGGQTVVGSRTTATPLTIAREPVAMEALGGTTQSAVNTGNTQIKLFDYFQISGKH
uniref:Uncharacterized protein n=2 Tax=Timema TaxID=61471 RepID=A0A7R9G6K2_TIMSH|nr:unnamed protein product [Timema shepardi]